MIKKINNDSISNDQLRAIITAKILKYFLLQ